VCVCKHKIYINTIYIYIYLFIYLYIYTHTHILHNIAILVGQINIRFGTAVKAVCQGNLSACHSVQACHRFVSLQRILEKVRY
jgi:hypothetical protein